MRLGIVDLGTNSLRFSFWEIDPRPKTAELLHRKKTMILPGEDVFTTGKIPSKSIKRMVKTLKQFEIKAQLLDADGVVAFATCALREAKNSKAVMKQIHSQTRVPLKIITGQREAELIAQGVLRSEAQLNGQFILIDIGGGSTEISLIKNRKILKSTSLPLGAQRLFQLYPHLMDGNPTELRMETAHELRTYIRKILEKRLKTWPRNKATRALGSSGTIRSLGKLISRRRAAKHSRLAWIRQINSQSKALPRYSVDELSKLSGSLMFLTEKQLLSLHGIEPKRRPLLTHGALLLEEILNYFSLNKVICTDGSLRDGVIQEIIAGDLKAVPLRTNSLKGKRAKARASRKKV